MNGYRSAEKTHEVQKLMTEHTPDILCLQEIKMNEHFPDTFGYECYYHFACKRGYSGVAVFTKEKPLNVQKKIGLERFDTEGRFLLLEYEKFVLINIYIPHGGRKKENHPYKFEVINILLEILQTIQKHVIICTDFNIAHTELDLLNYKTNYHNNMFSYPEREKIDELLSLGFVDSLRSITKDGNIYSMWPNGCHAREKNMGWRIDYIFVSKELETNIQNVKYLEEHLGSDHCPCRADIIMLERGNTYVKN